MNVLTNEFEGTIFFREERAERFPDDARNAEAAVLCKKLAAMPIENKELAAAYETAAEQETVDPDIWTETHSETFKSIGFQFHPDTADEVLEHLTDQLGIKVQVLG